jgi:hypothetical protein
MSLSNLLGEAAIVGLIGIPVGFGVLFQLIKCEDQKFLWRMALGYFLIGSAPYFVYEAAIGLSGLGLFVGATIVGLISVGIGFAIFLGSASLFFQGYKFLGHLLDFRWMILLFFFNGALSYLLYQVIVNTILPNLAPYRVCCHWC